MQIAIYMVYIYIYLVYVYQLCMMCSSVYGMYSVFGV